MNSSVDSKAIVGDGTRNRFGMARMLGFEPRHDVKVVAGDLPMNRVNEAI